MDSTRSKSTFVTTKDTFVATKIILVAALTNDAGLFLEGNLTPDPKLLAVRGLMTKCLLCAFN